MRTSKLVMLFVTAAAVVGLISLVLSKAYGQGTLSSPVTITGLGSQKQLPTDAEGSPYLPVQTADRQFTFDAESWHRKGVDIMPLLLDGNVLPRQVIICGQRLSMIQGSLRTSAVDESVYFPLTISGTAQTVPNAGCFAITPVASLRIKGIVTIAPSQLTTAVVTAKY